MSFSRRTRQSQSQLKSKRQDMGSGYSSLADNLTKFHELGLLGTLNLERLDEGHGIEAAWLQTKLNIITHAS